MTLADTNRAPLSTIILNHCQCKSYLNVHANKYMSVPLPKHNLGGYLYGKAHQRPKFHVLQSLFHRIDFLDLSLTRSSEPLFEEGLRLLRFSGLRVGAGPVIMLLTLPYKSSNTRHGQRHSDTINFTGTVTKLVKANSVFEATLRSCE